MSTARLIPETVGAERRRRLADPAAHRPAAAPARRLPADALVRRLQPLPVARLPHRPGGHPGDHRPRRCGQRLRWFGRQRRHRRRRRRAPLPGRSAGAAHRRRSTQAQGNGGAHHYLALILGTVGSLVTATTAMGQLERGLNRLYGVEQDRPFAPEVRPGPAAGRQQRRPAGRRPSGCSPSGAPLAPPPGTSGRPGVWTWAAGRWRLVLLGASIALLFRWCPRRRQPAWSWLAFGSGVSLVLWFVITCGLGAFFRHSRDFGETYGPLAGDRRPPGLGPAVVDGPVLRCGRGRPARSACGPRPPRPRTRRRSPPPSPTPRRPAPEPALSLSGDRS